MQTVDALFTPAEFTLLPQRDLSRTVCVVFDVLRATSSIVTALANGATAVIPVAEIPDALAVRRRSANVLLAGERDGLRIGPDLAEGVSFDFGNSPREFTPDRVRDRTIVTTTTNGTRALRACAHAQTVLVGSFLNLSATVQHLQTARAESLLLVCGGTFERAAYEDVLCAGAVLERLVINEMTDAALLALTAFRIAANDLLAALQQAENGRRLNARPELAEDVPFCATIDRFGVGAALDRDGTIRRIR